MFIYRFYKRTGKKINHLHDCVMLHPNNVMPTILHLNRLYRKFFCTFNTFI